MIDGINIPYLGKTNVYEQSLPHNVVHVSGTGNLPTPSSNIISLSDDTVYYFAGKVNIGDNSILLGKNTALLGNSVRTDGIFSEYNGNVICSTGKDTDISNLHISTPNGSSLNLICTGECRVRVDKCLFSGCSSVGMISGIKYIRFDENYILECNNGVSIAGPGRFARIHSNNCFENSGNATGIALLNGISGIFCSTSITNNAFSPAASQIGLFLDVGASTSGLLASNHFCNEGTFVTGTTKQDLGWKFEANKGIPNSIVHGSLWITGNADETNLTQGVYQKVSGYSYSGDLNERFIMSASGELQYIGTEDFYGNIFCDGDIHCGFFSVNGSVSFLKNDVLLGNTNRDLRLTSSPICFSVHRSAVLQKDDRISLCVRNDSSNQSIYVQNYNLNIFE